MATITKKREPVDDLLDALVWMRRKAKKHEPVDDLIDALMRMRRKTKKKTVKGGKARQTAKPGRTAKVVETATAGKRSRVPRPRRVR